MLKIIEGKIQSKSKRFGIIASRFNDFITKRLLQTCIKELKDSGVKEHEMIIVWVPGAFEIPLVAKKLAKQKKIDAVICLGAIIRGETYHFELVAQNAAKGILEVALLTEKPVIFGVLTTDTVNQAYKRSEAKGDNKGREAARSAIEMMSVISQI